MIIIYGEGEALYQCPLCGFKFTVREALCRNVCPLAEKCDLLLCPNCGYEFPRMSNKR
ncbi:MAG: hypothetical protein ACE5GD_06265 [Candidatus Geothermarchaeales archaeon]